MMIRAICLFACLLGLPACLDSGKIDTTNATLADNLEELRKLNKNFVAASNNLLKLGEPVDKMAEQFGRLSAVFEKTQDDFTRFMQVGTKASEELLRLSTFITPEKIRQYEAQWNEAVTQFSDFNRDLSERGEDLTQLLRQLTLSSAMVVKMGRLAGIMQPDEWDLIRDGMIAVVDSSGDLGASVQNKTREVLQRLDKAPLSPETIENLAANLQKLGSAADKWLPLADKAGVMLDGIDQEQLNLFLEELLPNIERTLSVLEELTAAINTFNDTPGAAAAAKDLLKGLFK